jgi:hypothetical protein
MRVERPEVPNITIEWFWRDWRVGVYRDHRGGVIDAGYLTVTYARKRGKA